ncbi:hypothetical protein, partial [Hoeflea sp.]|uniref:hypothetical protein n=1 Tax=Hoeflea sp. TaxID=1940281 RepID=UPI0025C01C34
TQNQKGKITRLTHRPHRGTYYPTGSILDGNPGSTLSGNQQGNPTNFVFPKRTRLKKLPNEPGEVLSMGEAIMLDVAHKAR